MPPAALPSDKFFWGVEQEGHVLFSDLRGFTKLSEQRLSYDVVFLLNQYLGRMSEAIEDYRRLCRQVHGRRHHGDLRHGQAAARRRR